MRNKLIFLGTAGDSLTLAKQRRAGGGFILQLEGGQYHIDPGPGALAAAAKANVSARETICVLISNNSLLASEGVNEVLDAMTLGGIDRFGVVVAAESVADGAEDERPIIREQAKNWVERVVTFRDTTRIGVNYLNIFPRKAHTLDPTALGFRLEGPNITIGYMGDTAWFDGITKEYAGVDILIVRCRHPKGAHEKGTLAVDEVIKVIEGIKPRVCVLTGLGNKLLDGDVIATARSIQRETKVQCIAAKDGFEVDIDQFAGKASQQTLKGYKK
ncbi:hypothetical protein GOV10_03865 [Candidatus Woesearchaeota archaeon]|nr:hypothetical protein [Candidatus Woesearchaeota archaeon]